MRIRKSILTLFAAISIATTSINPVNIYAWGHSLSGEYSNDMFSPINTKAHINEHYNYSIDTSSSDYIKYTGKELSNVPILYTSDTDGEYVLKDGIDYKIIGYIKVNDIDHDPSDTPFTKGRPTEPGYYKILIEGINSFKGKESINIAIVDPTELSFYDFRIIDNLFTNSGQIELEMYYYDSEKQKDEHITLTNGKDFTFNGWASEDNYKKNRKNLDKIKWTKTKVDNTGFYYFKITGISEFKNQIIIPDFYIYGAKDISNYEFSIRPHYNTQTKEFEPRLLSKYLIEGKNYSVSYCSRSEISEDEIDMGISDKHNWKPGYPKKTGNYAFMIKGKNEYKGYKAFTVHYSKTLNPQIVEKANLNTTITFAEGKTLAICPKKTGEYTIKTTAYANANSALYTNIYDSTFKSITETMVEADTTVSSSIKVNLNAGEVYYLTLNTSLNNNKQIPCTINIDGSYAYKKPKTIVRSNCIYSITKHADKNGKKGEVAVIGLKKKSAKKVTISNYIKINGKKYKVTHIDYNAFINNKKITTVKTGNSVLSICAGAFAGCKKLKTLVLGKNIKSIEKKALHRTSGKKLTIKVPKKYKKTYTKLIKNAKTNNYVVK